MGVIGNGMAVEKADKGNSLLIVIIIAISYREQLLSSRYYFRH